MGRLYPLVQVGEVRRGGEVVVVQVGPEGEEEELRGEEARRKLLVLMLVGKTLRPEKREVWLEFYLLPRFFFLLIPSEGRKKIHDSK